MLKQIAKAYTDTNTSIDTLMSSVSSDYVAPKVNINYVVDALLMKASSDLIVLQSVQTAATYSQPSQSDAFSQSQAHYDQEMSSSHSESIPAQPLFS